MSTEILRSFSILAALTFLFTAPAAAQDHASQPSSPAWRLDVDLPSVGIGGWWISDAPSQTHGALPVAAGAWFTHRTGHGAMLRAGWLATGFSAYGERGGEAAYQYAFTLVGDLRSGLSLAPYVGVTAGNLGSDMSGFGAGPLAGGNLSLHVWGFEVGLDLSYRAVFTPSVVGQGLMGMVRVGFSFWGS